MSENQEKIIKLSDKLARYKINYPLPEKLVIYRDAMLFTLSTYPTQSPTVSYDATFDRSGTAFSIWSPYLLEDIIMLSNTPKYINMFRLTNNLQVFTKEEYLLDSTKTGFNNYSNINFFNTGLILQETETTPKHANLFISSPRNFNTEYIGSYLLSPIEIKAKYGLANNDMKTQTKIIDE